MMSFWRTFGFHTVSPIETILDRSGFTLEELLDEEDLLQETKAQNQKLIDFLSRPETLAALFGYMVAELPEDPDQKRRVLKYSSLSADVLSAEVYALGEAIFANPEGNVVPLLSVFDSEPPLAPQLYTTVCKVVGSLFQRKQSEMFALLRARENFVANLVKHVGHPDVLALLQKLIASDGAADSRATLVWLSESGLVSLLIQRLHPESSDEINESVSRALSDIVLSPKPLPAATPFSPYALAHAPTPPPAHPGSDAPSPLLLELQRTDVLERLLAVLDVPSTASGVQLYGMGVVCELADQARAELYDEVTPVEELPTVLRLLVPRLPTIAQLLDHEPEPALPGGLKPVGSLRMKTLDLLAAFSRCNYASFEAACRASGMLAVAISLFFKYTHNNFMHSSIERLIVTSLHSRNAVLKEHIVRDCQLPGRLLLNAQANAAACADPRGTRICNMGHATAIALALQEEAKHDTAIAALLTETPGWTEFAAGELEETQALYTRAMGGQAMDSTDNDIRHDLVSKYFTTQPAEDDQDLSDDQAAFIEAGAFSSHEDYDINESSEESDLRVQSLLSNMLCDPAHSEDTSLDDTNP